jgi:SAM-dependent methyltransferase
LENVTDAGVIDGGSRTESVPCNLCESTDVLVVYPAVERTIDNLATEFRSSGDEPLADRLVKCPRCGLQFVSPRLRPDLILKGYREGTDEVFVSQAAAREHTFARCLTLIERYAPDRGRLFDVGTAAGAFLHVAQKRGWTVSGCEPNRWLCDWGRKNYGLDIQAGTIFDSTHPDGVFDAVTVWDVLEHTPDPMAFLRECRRVVRPGGLLIVNYPDIESWISRAMGRRWVFLLSVHLYYFTRRTLTAMLEKVGFDVVMMKPHYQWLELGYVLTRAEPAAGVLARLARRAVSVVRLDRQEIPYWMGQTLVVARRKE